MDKKHIKRWGAIVVILISVIFVFFLWSKSYQEKRTIMTHLHSVALYIHTFKREHGNMFPSSLHFIDNEIVPKSIINGIEYTYHQRKFYSVNIPHYDFSGSDLWFYYPYGNEAWVCMDGAVLINKIPLSNIKFNEKPIDCTRGVGEHRVPGEGKD